MVLTKHTRVLTLNDMERLERTLFRLEQGRPRYAFYIYLVGTSYTLGQVCAKCMEKYYNLCCTLGAKNYPATLRIPKRCVLKATEWVVRFYPNY